MMCYGVCDGVLCVCDGVLWCVMVFYGVCDGVLWCSTLPLVNSASGLNGPNALPGAVTPSGLAFFNTGANDAAKTTRPTNGAKNNPAPGYVTVSETPSANVNVLVENT